MANLENQPPFSPDPRQSLVKATDQGDPSEPSRDLTAAGPYASPNFCRTPQVVRGGLDANWFFHSLRRRWILALSLGLLLASAAGAGLYWAFPEADTAAARFLVAARQEKLLNDLETRGGTRDYDIFRATQIALIKSNTVLEAAIANERDLASIQFLQEEEDKIAWLSDNLRVSFEGESELLRVSLKLDENSEDLKTIVDVVCQAYIEKIVIKDRIRRNQVQDSLGQNLDAINKDIRRKWDEYRSFAEDIGSTEKDNFDPDTQLLFKEVSQLMKDKATLESEIRQMQIEYAIWLEYHNSPGLKEQMVEAQLAVNQEIMYMEQQMMGIRAQLRDAQGRSRNQSTRETRRIERELASLQQAKATLEDEMRQQIQQAEASRPDVEGGLVKKTFQMHMQMAMGRLQQIAGRDEKKEDGTVEHIPGDIDNVKEEIATKAKGSTELLIRSAELEQLQLVAKDLAQRIEFWDIELKAPDRIQWVEHAVITPGINKVQRYAISGIGGLATLLLTCFGIAYMEFLGRRLNGPEQVDEGLGLRVVGTLPSLNAKRLANPNHPLVAQLAESIDSVRTALMHDSTSKSRQVVLVTSPSEMEGRTTVASQLAASLARAGRRTLLIDGDIRRPALHSLFEVPLEDGLCEVLRAEAEVGDVVRPTHAEGLWVMTAGYCDADAVHAMATDQIQPIFEKLRADYDFVIIDGAPVLGLSDSLMIGQHCDGALLSVLRDHTSVPKIYQSTELLHSVGIRLIGAVVNGVTTKADRRVTHLQKVASKASRKQLETSES